jgi:hypothetical protein
VAASVEKRVEKMLKKCRESVEKDIGNGRDKGC